VVGYKILGEADFLSLHLAGGGQALGFRRGREGKAADFDENV
jgi:hypothetical protein